MTHHPTCYFHARRRVKTLELRILSDVYSFREDPIGTVERTEIRITVEVGDLVRFGLAAFAPSKYAREKFVQRAEVVHEPQIVGERRV